MAGAGYKLFNTGDVLTAAQVNTYLQQQVTMVFADSSARTTALSGVLAEGMMSYLQDTNAVEVYNGSSWVNVGNAGDITEVQAGTGISVASGTGPIPVVTNSMATTIDAKGDLIVGTGADTFGRLAVGTNGYTIVADSTETTGLKWQAMASGGKVKQIVSAVSTTDTTNSTSSFATTNISASITPTNSSNKVIVWVHIARGWTGTGSIYSVWQGRIKRGSTVVYSDIWGLYSETSMKRGMSIDAYYVDSPATTSSTTYTIEFVDSGAGTYANLSGGNIVLMEVEI
jgi:hypothetical protein